MRPSVPSLVNILVPVKRAIDYAVKIRIAKDGKGVDTTVKHSMVSLSSGQLGSGEGRAEFDKLSL